MISRIAVKNNFPHKFEYVLLTLMVSCILGTFQQTLAQTINPYSRLIDPLAIANLDSSSIMPLRYATGHGTPNTKDSTGANILASDTGEGVICHIWSAVGEPDSTTWMRLWIDDVLVKEGKASNFFYGKDTGLFLTSFDSAASGGYDCDIQLPFRHGFRLTWTSVQGNIWFAVAWRRLLGNALTTSAADPDSELLRAESQAAAIADQRSWDRTNEHPHDTETVLIPGSSTVLWSLTGPSVITSLRFNPIDWNIPFDSLWLQIYWNGSDSASVDAPLSDFFGQGAGFVPISSLAITSSRDSGFACNFPMPFEHGAKIVLVNFSSNQEAVSARINFIDTTLNWNTTGYFHAHFSESNPTRFGVLHPVLHWKGPGRFAGLNLSIPHNQYACALEGNPVFGIDSTPSLSFEYTGTEDYFGGGFYFGDGEFSHPFCGCTQKWFSFYRFHILDAVDFNRSIDFDFQHGNNNDVSCDYRSVAYFYSPWSQCWVMSDSVITGRLFTLFGSAYSPLQSIDVRIGTRSVANISANSDGSFRASILVPSDLSIGTYLLSVSGQPSCLLNVLAQPILKILSDSANLSVSPGDSLSVVGWGFDPKSNPSFLLGGVRLTLRFLAIDSLGRLRAKLIVPPFPAGQFVLSVVVGNDSWTVDEPVKIAARIWIEAEDLRIDTFARGVASQRNLCPWWNARWSKQEVLDFQPDSVTAFFIGEFNVVRGGAYSLIVHGTQGVGFGNYQIVIDNSASGILEGTSTANPPIPAIMDTLNIQLDSGLHVLRINYLGTTSSASAGELWLDALEFAPIPPSVIVVQAKDSQLKVIQDQTLETVCVIFDEGLHGNANLELYDVAGRKVEIKLNLSEPIESFPTRSLPNGVYFLVVNHNVYKLLILH